jgi:hypothetical protein
VFFEEITRTVGLGPKVRGIPIGASYPDVSSLVILIFDELRHDFLELFLLHLWVSEPRKATDAPHLITVAQGEQTHSTGSMDYGCQWGEKF